ncbi:response regulator [Burkholderiaceae bacterium DAT-1]|nr:response regulator [Burkholderiaceae bacterium DAT-1]
MTQGTVWVAEDDPRIAEVVLAYLQHAGCTTRYFDRGDAVLTALDECQPDVLLLDIMMPGLDGVAVCQAIRQRFQFPVLMVTARVEEIDRLLGFESGADDYVCKPFSPRELMARVKVHLRRRPSATPEPAVSASLFVVDEAAQRIHCQGQLLNLTPQEFRLLMVLMRSPGRIFSRAHLLELAYDHSRDVFDRTVDSHIKNLRKKLATILPDLDVIHSVYGVGYRFEL